MRISDWSSDVCSSVLRLRAGREDWNAPGTWAAFWTRRFFRLAPLFYVTLAAALIAGPAIYADRVVIDSFLGQSLQPSERYLDGSLTNIALHLSFLLDRKSTRLNSSH